MKNIVFEKVESFVQQASSELLNTSLVFTHKDEKGTFHFEGILDGETLVCSVSLPQTHEVLFAKESLQALLVFKRVRLVVGGKLVLQVDEV